jgi:pantoate--beta-alanine ligase
MSSRNRYLSASERDRALTIPRALRTVGSSFAAGERDAARLLALLEASLAEGELKVEYASLAHSGDLHLISEGTVAPGEAGIFIAARVGATRLIDNLIFGVDPLPAAGAR